ncbi:MAG: AAA family ATPase [Chloroflexota bacterium]
MAQRILDRSHLFSSLHASALPPVITIMAPSGYGKSVLARQMASHLDMSTVWHTATPWQRDSTRLHKRAVSAWQSKYSWLMVDVEGQTPESHALALTDALRNAIETPTFYLLDDVHHLADCREAERWLETLIATKPEHITLVLVGQTVPNLRWRQHMYEDRVQAFTVNDLRWTAEELIQQGRVEAERAHYLVDRYAGMAASLRLAIDPALQSDASVDKQADRTFRQLIQGFFAAQSLRTQHLLLTAATVETITPQISGSLFRSPDLIPYMAQLHTDHMLVSRMAEGYQLHALFRDFLQQQLMATQPKRFTQLHIQAAHWFEEQDKVEQAIEHYIAAEAWQQAIRLGEMVAAEWHKCGNWQSLLHVNQLLLHQPAPRLRLLSASALCDMNRVADSHAQLNEAERLYEAQCNEDAVLKVIVHRAHNFAWEGDYARAYDLLEPYKEDDTPPRLTQA